MRKESVRTLWLLAIVVATVCSGAAQAADRFVSVLGDDTANDCLSSVAPCRTIEHAETQAASGDVVKVARGRYDGFVTVGFGVAQTLTFSGSWEPDFSSRDAAARSTELSDKIFVTAQPTTVVDVTVDGFTLTREGGIDAESLGDGVLTVALLNSTVRNSFNPGIAAVSGGTSTLDVVVSDSTFFAIRTPLGISAAIGLFCHGASTMTFAMTDSSIDRVRSFVGGSGVRAFGDGLLTASLTRVLLARSRGAGVLFDASNGNLTLTDVTITGNRSGILLLGGNATVTNSIVARNRGQGIVATSPAFAPNLQVVNSTIQRNRSRCGGACAAGLQADDTATVDLLNTIVWDNRARAGAADDLLVAPGAVVSVDHSDLGDVSGTYADLGGNVSVDPEFLNRRNEHLTAASPLIDAGTCTGAPATDIDGDVRPTGAGCDIGADEFVP